MHRITIDDLSFCVVETANASQVCGGGFAKTVYSGTGDGAWSASTDNAYGVAYKAGYTVDKNKRSITAGVDAQIASGVSAAVAGAVSNGEQYVSTQANAKVSLSG